MLLLRFACFPSAAAVVAVPAVVSCSVELIVLIVPRLSKIISKVRIISICSEVCAFHGKIVLKLDP